MPVSSIARRTVVTEEPTASVADVVRTMQQESVGSVVVVEGGEPRGLVTDRDLAMAVLNADFDAESTPVSELLTGDPITVEASSGIYDLVELLSERGLRRVPVVEEGDLVGIVSLSDVVVLLGMELQHVANAIRTASPAYEQLATEFYD